MSRPVITPSAALWGAAVAGALGALACEEAPAPSDDSDTPAPADDSDDSDVVDPNAKVITSRQTLPDYTWTDMVTACEALGGLMQTHATCAGNNACRGLSFQKWTHELTEHTCRAMNACAGASCVVLPEDAGDTGPELYARHCSAGCHLEGFRVFHDPYTTGDEALLRHTAMSAAAMRSVVAFGVRGLNASGTASANMPAFHERLSVAEIDRVIAHARSLPAAVSVFEIVGETQDFTDVE